MELDVNELFFWEPIALAGTPFEINRVVVLMWVASILCIGFFLLGARRGSLVPKGIQNIVETAYLFVRNNIAVDVMGLDGVRYASYLTTVFFFIFFCNLLEIVPGINFPVTSRMAIPLALAVLSYLIFNFVGIRKQGLVRYFKDTLWPKDVPIAIRPLYAVLELFSVFVIRLITLPVRLLANMMAGHVLLTIFFLFTADFIAFDVTLPLGIVTAIVASGLIVFELLVIGIQAYIFTVLTAFYISEALHGHGAEDDEPSASNHREVPHETEGLSTAA